jgi:hypothetical protein
MHRQAVVPILLSLAAFACAARTDVVSVDRVRDVDFTHYRSFAWTAGLPAGEDAESFIHDSVTRELDAVGLRRADERPDLLVSTYVLPDRHSLEELADPVTWAFWTGIRDVRASDVGAGTLVLDLRDARTERLVWRGLVAVEVDVPVDRMERRLGASIRRLIRQYPAG